MSSSFWKGFEKKASEKEEPSALRRKTQGAAATALGGALAYQSVDPLTGRVTVYHGTHPDKVKSIVQQGLQPSFGGTGASASTKVHDAGTRASFIRDSSGRVHITKEPRVARSFADIALGGRHAGVTSNFHPNAKKGVVRASIPQALYDKFEKDPAFGIMSNKGIAARGSQAIPGKYIRGNKSFWKERLKDLRTIPQYAMAHPKQFGLGALGTVGGIGGVAWGLHRAFSRPAQFEKKAGNPLVSAMPGIRSGIKKLEQGGLAAAAKPTSGVSIAARSQAPQLPLPKPVHVRHNLSAIKPPANMPKVTTPKPSQSGRGVSSTTI